VSRGGKHPPEQDVIEAQRLDKWLVYARVVKTRTLAAKLVEKGAIRINGQRCTVTHKHIHHGDVLTLRLEHGVFVWRILDCAERRGPAREAQLLYEDISNAPSTSAP
jgi:ribosome-associated heat shock protein Hsp15